MRRLQEDGFEVYVCCGEDEYTAKIASEGNNFLPMAFERKGANLLKDLTQFFLLYRIYKKLRPDIVFHFTIKPNIYGSWAAYLAGVPFINTVSGLGYVFLQDNLFCRIVRLMYKVSCSLAHKVFFQNADDLTLFRKGNLFKDPRLELVCGSGVDTDYFKPISTDIPKVEKTGFRFLFSGRLLFDKGVGEYIEAAEEVKKVYPETVFQVLGPVDSGNPAGISAELIEQWVKKGVITYSGFTDDVRPYLAAADCIVLPSYREGTPKSLLEAMAMAKPIIATEAVGCREVIENEINGLAIKIKNVQSLRDAMLKMISFSDERRKMLGSSGRKKVLEKFTDTEIMKKYSDTVKQFIKD